MPLWDEEKQWRLSSYKWPLSGVRLVTRPPLLEDGGGLQTGYRYRECGLGNTHVKSSFTASPLEQRRKDPLCKYSASVWLAISAPVGREQQSLLLGTPRPASSSTSPCTIDNVAG